MTNVNLSLVVGYPVEAPAPNEHVSLPTFSLRAALKRMAHAVRAAERRRKDAEIADFLARNGGTLTDDLERQICDRFGG